jgi:hypothetical protein
MAEAQTATKGATPTAPPMATEAPAGAQAALPLKGADAPAQEKATEAKAEETEPSGSFLGDAASGDKEDGDASAPVEAKPVEDIKITVPEGVAVDAALLGSFEAFARAKGLSNEIANGVAGLYAEHIAQQNKLMDGAIERQSDSWRKELESDPQFGGAKLDESKQALARFQRKYGSDEFRADTKRIGIDNLPSFVRLARKIGMDLGEDDSSGGKSVATKTKQETVHDFWPKSTTPDGAYAGGGKR